MTGTETDSELSARAGRLLDQLVEHFGLSMQDELRLRLAKLYIEHALLDAQHAACKRQIEIDYDACRRIVAEVMESNPEMGFSP